MAFLFHFLHQWADEDWIPTFELGLLDANDDPPFNYFRGIVRQFDPSTDTVHEAANLTSSIFGTNAIERIFHGPGDPTD